MAKIANFFKNSNWNMPKTPGQMHMCYMVKIDTIVFEIVGVGAFKSSTLLQASQSRSSAGTLLTPYLPVSIFNGATPHLNLAYADLYFLSTIMLKYG